MKNILFKSISSALFAIPLLFIGVTAQAAVPTWDVTGTYKVNVDYQGTAYAHDAILSQDNMGMLTGNGGSPAGANIYTWVVATGSVSGNDVDLYANYTATPDAVTPQTVMHLMGSIAQDGKMSGTWSDNYQAGTRTGTWQTTEGVAEAIVAMASLGAEDFGVVNYDTGLGMLKGYSAGFGLTSATFAGAQSVVVQLYSGATLLQTNTATPKVAAEITGNQISSPFDVSGTFNYATDGYWTNVRGIQYGQSLPATKVVATVTLLNGQVVTATNNTLAGDASTIYPVIPPTGIHPTEKSECKNSGWKTFTNPTFKNQGQCIAYVNNLNDDDKNDITSIKHRIQLIKQRIHSFWN